MSEANIWHLNISYIGTGEDGERANEIIVTARKQGKPVYGEGLGGTLLTRTSRPAKPR